VSKYFSGLNLGYNPSLVGVGATKQPLVSEKYKITTQDIQTYQANKKKRQMSNSLRNNPVNLNMIYSLLLEINSKLS
jgi:hypothetical protein